MALNKLSPEELQRLRNDLKSALDDQRQIEAELALNGRLEPSPGKNFSSSPQKHATGSGEILGCRVYRVNADLNRDDFAAFLGHNNFSVRYEHDEQGIRFVSLSVGGYSFVQMGDIIVVTPDGEIFNGRPSY
jgi:hypothetical protein